MSHAIEILWSLTLIRNNMNTATTLYICKANVWRSQIAEWIHNKFANGTNKPLSLAWSEARKVKYNWSPSSDIVKYMSETRWIEIVNQRISYIMDLPTATIDAIQKTIFLYDPEKDSHCDDACKINEESPYEYLRKRWFNILISPVADPFETGEVWFDTIYDDIYKIVINNI